MGRFLRRPGTGLSFQEAVSAGCEEELAFLHKARFDRRPPRHNCPSSLIAGGISPGIMGEGLQILDNGGHDGFTWDDIHGTIFRTLEEQATKWSGTVLLGLLSCCLWHQAEVASGA